MNGIRGIRFTKLSGIIGLSLLILIGLGELCRTEAKVEPETGFLAVTEENDSLARPFASHQDRHYTQGIKVVAFGGDDFLPGVTNAFNQLLPTVGIRPTAAQLGWIVVGQNIYTPSNLLAKAQNPADRPYAGWLYTGFVFQRRGDVTPTLETMENFEVNIGIVGPDSIAEEAQKTVHRWWFSDDVPRGWNNQLRDEPGLVLKYLRLYRWSPTTETAKYIDVIGRIGGEVGNVFDIATAGGTLRVGYNLPNDFGAAINDSPGSPNGGTTPTTPGFCFYGFAGVDGRLVGHNITLDGNTGRGGPHVTKNVFVSDVSWGFGIMVFRHVEFAYTQVDRAEEFRGQHGNDFFGSITVKGTYCF